ncbi:Fe-S cluster assembly protein SufD [Microbacterium sp. cx-55]|uniref:Fe-S cluster assembly protein SufD n=1 Tax=Microbacterium sp. cx-55 TaxID=2875948 RepID=UPI001CBDA3E2|nr:Fe-S cluster assembly protein SufD [Microbacterium sp. cx-55]MBZ4486501.1 Fe-S cluster assembly protein SufD [Microbacterium sp. cx-55]UGB36530.1 Fe-S cluster assembly protein SufD [Microbacterium sp. cx-55]
MSSATQAPAETHTEGHIDPAAAFVPVQTRSERLRSFDPSDFGAPTGREVNWKHTPIARVQRLLDDAPGDGGAVGISVSGPLAAAGLAIGAAPRGEVFRPEDISAAIAWSRSAEALYLSVPANAELDEPSVIDLRGVGGRAHQHLVIEAGTNSRATVILRHAGAAAFAQNVEIIVRDGADLTVLTLQEWDDDAVHLSAHQSRVDRDARLRHIVISFGGGVVRVNPSVELAGSGSRGELYGLSFADAGQHLESQVYMFHKGPQTSGDVLYKGALQGDTARSVWIGDVLIGPYAVGTDSYEANRNLVLTDGARADSIPNLEIQTGDIRGAGHASATGRFDDEQLFYLQARGIGEDEARRLVVLGFLMEIVQKIGIPELEDGLVGRIEAELAEGELR